MRNFSCAFSRLYGSGGFYEGAEVAEALVDIGDACRWAANLYPAYTYARPQPAHILSGDTRFCVDLLEHYRMWDVDYSRGASTDLFVLEDGLLFNRCLYKALDGEIVQMYETNKPNDRPWRPELDPATHLKEIKQPHDGAADFFYLGSIGSQNYGHWLVDDLTRARSLIVHFSPDRMPIVVLNACSPVVDAVREQTLRTLLDGRAEVEIVFLNHESAYFFPRLYFVSPSSYHPFLKCPLGIDFLREHFIPQAARMSERETHPTSPHAGKRIFVTRRALWRNVFNIEAVVDYFRALSFDIIELDGMSFVAQVLAFSRAETIVGVMGAGMVNAVFSPAGAAVVQLAPDGWKDPFFWDLAANKQHRYSVLFGTPWKPEAPSFSSFTIDMTQLDVVKAWL